MAPHAPSYTNEFLHRSPSFSSLPSYHTHVANENDSISNRSMRTNSSHHEIQRPASARPATNPPVQARSAEINPGAVEAGHAVRANDASNRNCNCKEKSDWSSMDPAWIVMLFWTSFTVLVYGPDETHDCPQLKPHETYSRYTCGPFAWCLLALLSLCASRVASMIWKRLLPCRNSRSIGWGLLCIALHPVFEVAVALGVFGGCAYWRWCFKGCTEDR